MKNGFEQHTTDINKEQENIEIDKEKTEQHEHDFFSVRDIIHRMDELIQEGRFGESIKEISLPDDLSKVFSIRDGRITVSLNKFKDELSFMLTVNYPIIRAGDETIIYMLCTVLQEFGCIPTPEEELKNTSNIKYLSPDELSFNMPRIIERDCIEFPDQDVQGTPANEIPDNIVLLSSPHYGKTAMQRSFPWKGKHAWAIRRSDLEDFLRVYPDGEFVEVIPERDSLLYAIDFEEADKYVCEISDSEATIPTIEKFDPEKHLVEEGERPFNIFGGFNDDIDSDSLYFITPFQVLIRESENKK